MACPGGHTGSVEGPIGMFCNGGPVGGTAGTMGCTGGPMAPSTTHRALGPIHTGYSTIQPPAHTHRASSAVIGLQCKPMHRASSAYP